MMNKYNIYKVISFKNIIRFCFAFFSLLLMSIPAYPQQNNSIEEQYLRQINQYFDNIKSFTGEFQQINNDETKTGKFYVMKPDMVKWEYISPRKITVVMKKENIVYYDHQMEEITHLPNKDILSQLFTMKNVAIQQIFDVKQLYKADSKLIIEIANKKTKSQRQDDENINSIITIYFALKPLFSIETMHIVNDYSTTTLSFHNLNHNAQLAPSDFQIKNQKFFKLRSE